MNSGTSSPATADVSDGDVKAIDDLRAFYDAFRKELGKIIVGQEMVIEQLAVSLFSRGHGLLVGVPGLAKTLLIRSLAESLDLSFNRIQFTPDLMPADITGTDILQETNQPGRRAFDFVPGRVFANFVLADEINRAPAKTKWALLEAMLVAHVTVLGRNYPLPLPFFVLATQNPVEQEGTYPLPEAQLDRFMFLIRVDYPSVEEEKEIARATTGGAAPELKALLGAEEVMRFQELVRRLPVPEHLYDLAVDIVRRTRPDGETAPDWLKKWVSWGAGPRAVQSLILGAKGRAALYGSYMVRMEDLEAVAEPVLGHRVLTNFAAQSEGVSSGDIVRRLWKEANEG
ncbi:MAG: AAA family ATPase [Verrucomicrobiota bacterium]